VGDAAIRPVRPEDLDALYDICLRTGDAGKDATSIYSDPRLLGDLYVAPYAVLEPERAFVVDDGTGQPQGYIVGAADSRAFEARCEAEWWPAARARHGRPEDADGIEAIMLAVLQQPLAAHPKVVEGYPSHLHIDLLPPFQSGGWGSRLMATLFDALRAAGSPGVHLNVSEANTRAIGFYEHLGMEQLHADGYTRTYGLRLGSGASSPGTADSPSARLTASSGDGGAAPSAGEGAPAPSRSPGPARAGAGESRGEAVPPSCEGPASPCPERW
jgi:ribosomal protein S18 acetylase RimI-like enzyme